MSKKWGIHMTGGVRGLCALGGGTGRGWGCDSWEERNCGFVERGCGGDVGVRAGAYEREVLRSCHRAAHAGAHRRASTLLQSQMRSTRNAANWAVGGRPPAGRQWAGSRSGVGEVLGEAGEWAEDFDRGFAVGDACEDHAAAGDEGDDGAQAGEDSAVDEGAGVGAAEELEAEGEGGIGEVWGEDGLGAVLAEIQGGGLAAGAAEKGGEDGDEVLGGGDQTGGGGGG